MSRGRTNRKKALKKADKEFMERLSDRARRRLPLPNYVVLPSGKLMKLNREDYMFPKITVVEPGHSTLTTKDGKPIHLHHLNGVDE